ncbi:mitochondrial 54S ribosomal protein mL41 [Kwoniella pini CBS 10737]|uniref:Uncharacterized protein n=1 Tax=Kwoniella pini CBS 10737 TaxID=1296096 RepID=A0A1B9I915_9TREE|nr:uncharacterized protein I206_01304 [Kwoniella pini CBS 10737]OCF52020.1 hypothetical protein I206_01304 [Kwoniella pini CBS 10737]
MRPTSIIAGASRLPLTPKRGNKDFYKGTGQSRVPGGGHRTGPPGVHVVKGKAKYRVLDEKVRVFVGPGSKVLEETELRPYVGTQEMIDSSKGITKFFNPYSKSSSSRPKFPSFSPMPLPPKIQTQTTTTTLEGGEEEIIGKLNKKHFTKFSKKYQNLNWEEKQSLIMQHRREWFEAMSNAYGGGNVITSTHEEQQTQELENRSNQSMEPQPTV